MTKDEAPAVTPAPVTVPPMANGRAPTVLTQDQLNEVGQRLMSLTPGGSEYFNRYGDGYCVDVDACLNFIEHQKRTLFGRLSHKPPAPTGCKLVPREPTQAMLDEVTAADQHPPWNDANMRSTWQAMYDAAPAQEEP